MSHLSEVPTEELLSFHDYPSVHTPPNQDTAQINVDISFAKQPPPINPEPLNDTETDVPVSRSFWTIEYYQQFFDVDTKDVIDRIIASVTPKRDNSLKNHLRNKPDLYGPLWISITLIFTIAISGNIANYFQHASNGQYHWKYDFHLVSYAATAIYIYMFLVPFALWGLLKWSSDNNSEELEENPIPGTLELICIYGYSLFIYIPVSILWTIQIGALQWSLVLIAAFISGSVLLFTLMPALQLSRHKLILIAMIIGCHTLLAAGFMLYFFHVPQDKHPVMVVVHPSVAASHVNISKTK